jgi:hypothetical protein
VFDPNQNKNQIKKRNLGRNPNPKSKGVGAHLVAADGRKALRRRPKGGESYLVRHARSAIDARNGKRFGPPLVVARETT